MKKRWVRSHVELCLRDIWHVPTIVWDADGEVCFRGRTAACMVAVDTGAAPWTVHVSAHAAFGVRRSMALLRELDEVNARSRAVRAFWCDGVVMVRQSLHAEAVSRRTLQHALDGVTAVADDLGPMVAAVHGGHTPFALEGVDRAG